MSNAGDVVSDCLTLTERTPSGTPDQMFASLTFTFLSLLGVIPSGMCLSFVFIQTLLSMRVVRGD